MMISRAIYLNLIPAILLTFFWVVVPLSEAQEDDNELFLIAQKAFEDGFYDVAIRYINQFLEQFPQSEKRIQVQLLLGQSYFFKSQYLKAFEIFQELKKYSEFKDATLFWLGETYFKGSDYKQSEVHYQQLIELYPDSVYRPQAYYSLAWAYFEEDNFELSQKTFLKFIQLFPAHQLSEDSAFKLGECAFQQKHYEPAISYFRDYVLKYPQSSRHSEAYFYIAESYYYWENFAEAIIYYSKTAEISQDKNLTALSKISLGWSHLKLADYDTAQKAFHEALEIAKEIGIATDDISLGQATLFLEKKDYPQALEAYKQIIKKFPQSPRVPEAKLGIANIYYIKKDYPKAIAEYQSFINESSSSGKLSRRSEVMEKAYYGLAWTYLKSGQIDLSIQTFEQIMHQTESKIVKVSALTQIGEAYHDQGQFEKSLEIYDKILREFPDSLYSDYIQYRQGITLLKMEKLDAAALSFQSLQTNFPNSGYLQDVPYYLAVAHFKKGDWTSAKKYILDFLTHTNPDNEFTSESYYILALSYFNKTEFQEALREFQKIAKLFPQDDNILKNAELGTAKSLYHLKQTKEAIKKFEEIISRFPKSDVAQDALLWLGNHFLETSVYNQAVNYYQIFLQDFPGSTKTNMVQFELGQAYEIQGLLDKAIYHYRQIGESSDKELYAKARLAIADIFAKEMDAPAAIATYQNIINTSPEFIRDAYIKIAEIYEKIQDYPQAVEAYQQALKSDRSSSEIKNVELQFYIADMYEILRDYNRAVEEYLKIPYLYTEEHAWIVKAFLRIARIFEDQEMWEEAKSIYQKIIDYKTDELIFAQERIDWINSNTVLPKL